MYRSMLTPITAGIYAYIWMLECVWLGCRPRWLDRIIGLPGIYVLHGVLGTGALALVVYHQYVLPSFDRRKQRARSRSGRWSALSRSHSS